MSINAKYNTSQSALYAIADLVTTSLEEELPFFTAYRPKYVQQYVDDLRDAIDAAEILPAEQQRNSAIEIAAIQLVDTYGKTALNRWQDLKRYIVGAFPSNLEKPKLEEAGSLIYSEAANGNWDKLRSLMNFGRTFIQENSAALLANGNMPAGFTAVFNTARGDVHNKINAFYQLRDNKKQHTNAKIIANNALWDMLTEITLDGQQIFRNDPGKRAQFVMDNLKLLVDGPGTSGIRGYILDAVTEMPIHGAIVTILNINKTNTTEANGRYQILQASGTYTIRIEAPGYQTQEIVIEIPLGHLTSETVLMMPE